ncbi:MAG TPA: DUF4333 domain-containing protein [Pseudonocardiaceae bacterium]|jgi:hypothetical protein
MSTPYVPPGSEEPTQGRQQLPGQQTSGQQSYHPQGHPQPGYNQQARYRQPIPTTQAYGQQYSPPAYAPYGYQAYEPRDRDQLDSGRPRRRSALPWILSGVAAAVVVVMIVVLGFIAPGFFTTTIFDQNAVQDGVQRILSDEYGQQAQSVTCPADQEVRPGSTFTCQAVIDGARRNITITVKTDAGEYEVARPS